MYNLSALSRNDIKKIEDYWVEIDEYRKKLQYREWELLHKHRETDENIGGGKSNRTSDTTFVKATALVEDKKYNNLKSIVDGIDRLYRDLDKDSKTIVDMRYWDKENNFFEWEEIADQLFMSRNKVLRKRNALIDKTAEVIGFV